MTTSLPLSPSVPSATTVAGHWLAGLKAIDIPQAVRDVALNCVIDTIGVSLAAHDSQSLALARAEALELYAPGPSRLFGGGSLTPEGAAFVNVAASHALDFDDNSYAGIVHGSAVLVPAALAVAQSVDASGEDLLTALVAGAEIEYALAVAVTNEIYEAGWWTTAVFGSVGAAAVSAKLLGLDGDAAANALAFALCGSGGLRACFGTAAKPVLAGQAAANGVRAARLAARGLTVPHGVIEDHRGFARLLAQGRFDVSVIKALGRHWYSLKPGVDTKPYPVCLASHAALDGLRDLMDKHGLTNDDIQSVHTQVPPVVAANLTYDRPTTAGEARFSMPFSIACGLIDGNLTLDHLTDERVRDAHLQETMAKVTMQSDPDWNANPAHADAVPEAAYVTVKTLDGRVFHRFAPCGRGMVARPFSATEHRAKFIDCAARAIGPLKASALHAQLLTLADLSSLTALSDSIVSGT